MRKILIYCWIILLFLLGVKNSFAEEGTGMELANYQQPGILVEQLSGEAKKLALTEKMIEAAVIFKLKQAELEPRALNKDADSYGDAYIYVNVSLVGVAFTVTLALNRTVLYKTGDTYYVLNSNPTWIRSITGTHANNRKFVLQSVSKILDVFLDEYFEANR